MNQHVNRRTLMTTGVATAGAAFSVVVSKDKAMAKSPESIPGGEAFFSIDERLDSLPPDVAQRLRVAVHALLDGVEAMIERGESYEAIAAYCEDWGSSVSRGADAVTA
ncbi:hypothetical protein C1D09_024455 [Mesorhizobium intechi]|uniref:hypothetical protein n=1 Tax=Mesorhizobium intechi TaxID=537601 RepID=UPI000CC455FD|nr:hypothetical protein [Mesorhizobium intechi]TSE04261.1 hypothetical protein C1D09_024455 [Mesorhizobium intechi]